MGQLAHKAAVLAGIASRRFAFSGPLFATISLSSICNLNCRFCHYRDAEIRSDANGRRTSRFLDYDAACRLLDDLRDMGTELAIFLGEGEPLLYPQLIELLHECRKRGIGTEVFSNGLRLDPVLSAELVRAGLGAMKISIMADCAEHYEELRKSGRKETWEQVWQGVDSLVKARGRAGARKPRIILHHMVCRITRDRLGRMVENARRAKADGVTFTPLVEQPLPIPDLALNEADIPDVCRHLREIDASLKKTPLSCNAEDAAARLEAGPYVHRHMPCWIGWLSMRIQTNGDVFFCHAVDQTAGNILQRSFREIWQSGEYRSFRRIAGKCGGIAAPEMRASCHYCCYFPHHERIRKLRSVRGIVQALCDTLTTEE